jgi:hypothetical protein
MAILKLYKLETTLRIYIAAPDKEDAAQIGLAELDEIITHEIDWADFRLNYECSSVSPKDLIASGDRGGAYYDKEEYGKDRTFDLAAVAEGLVVDDADRIRELEEEIARLKLKVSDAKVLAAKAKKAKKKILAHRHK